MSSCVLTLYNVIRILIIVTLCSFHSFAQERSANQCLNFLLKSTVVELKENGLDRSQRQQMFLPTLNVEATAKQIASCAGEYSTLYLRV